jgi:hypothetical protein
MQGSDWEYVFNTFAFGYAIGYHFTNSTYGSCNGTFLSPVLIFHFVPSLTRRRQLPGNWRGYVPQCT